MHQHGERCFSNMKAACMFEVKLDRRESERKMKETFSLLSKKCFCTDWNPTTQEMLLFLRNIVCQFVANANKSQIFPNDTTEFDPLNETTRK